VAGHTTGGTRRGPLTGPHGRPDQDGAVRVRAEDVAAGRQLCPIAWLAGALLAVHGPSGAPRMIGRRSPSPRRLRQHLNPPGPRPCRRGRRPRPRRAVSRPGRATRRPPRRSRCGAARRPEREYRNRFDRTTSWTRSPAPNASAGSVSTETPSRIGVRSALARCDELATDHQ
jgi:hypothetical protein